MKYLIRLLFAIMLLFSFTQFAIAQEKNGTSDISVGANIAYRFDLKGIGIQVNGYYTLNEKMRVGADFIYWFIPDIPSSGDRLIEVTIWGLNGNFHYLFYDKNDLVLYGLGSLGYLYIEETSEYLGVPISSPYEKINLGVGAGLEYNLGGVICYAESRKLLTGLKQLTLSVGLRIPFWSGSFERGSFLE